MTNSCLFCTLRVHVDNFFWQLKSYNYNIGYFSKLQYLRHFTLFIFDPHKKRIWYVFTSSDVVDLFVLKHLFINISIYRRLCSVRRACLCLEEFLSLANLSSFPQAPLLNIICYFLYVSKSLAENWNWPCTPVVHRLVHIN